MRRFLLCVSAVAVVIAIWLGYQARTVYMDVGRTYHPAPRISAEPKATPVTDFFGGHRINVLLLGSDNDQKFQQRWPLTQSMIVVTIDPVHDKVGMLSIPRDFWVQFPGGGMGKIDTAASLGGVSLARATVENLFHINIDYYAWVGLKGFSSVVDDFGGVTVNVTHPILDDFYPDDQGSGDPYAYTRIFIPPGWHHLSGRQALNYVRSRHGDAVGDFGRSDRQQQVLMQLQKQANGWNLLLKIPDLSHDLSTMVRTDMGFNKLLDVARLSRHIQLANITRVVLTAPKYCQYSTSADGQSILVPNWDAILPAARSLFAPIRRVAPPAHSASAHLRVTASATPAATAAAKRTPTAAPTLTMPTPGHLPGSLIYAAGGTFYRMDRQGRVTRIMPSWMSAADMPAISSDGRTLAFVRWSTDASDIDIYHLSSGRTPTQITNDRSNDPTLVSNSLWAAWPAWRRDGKTILFSGDGYKLQLPADESRGNDLAIYATSPDGTNMRQLTTPDPGAGGDTDPQFLGKGSQYLYDHWAYARRDGLAVGQPYSQLMIRDLNDPSRSWTLTPASGQIVQPSVDRTGTRVVFLRGGHDASRMVVARIVRTHNGPQLRNQTVIATGRIAQPAFTPDGRWVSYLQADGAGFAVYLVSVNGGPTHKLEAVGNGVDATSRPIWSW